MKKTRLFLYCAVLAIVILAAGCSDYNKVLKSKDPDLKFTRAKEYYNEGECFKALPLLEELIGLTRGSDKAEEVYYYYAYSHYCVKDYYLANYYFKSFVKTYPQSRYSEECLYMAAVCSAELSPAYSLDQQDTKNAIDEFQLFLDRYPDSPLRDTTNVMIAQLNYKLEKKDYEIARLYVKNERYKAAVGALKQMLKDYPGSRYREEIMYLIVKSSYLYAGNSIPEKQEERYRAAMESYFTFAAAFPNSKWLNEAEDYYQKSRKHVEKLNTGNTTVKDEL